MSGIRQFRVIGNGISFRLQELVNRRFLWKRWPKWIPVANDLGKIGEFQTLVEARDHLNALTNFYHIEHPWKVVTDE